MTNPTDLRALIQGLSDQQITDLVTSLPPDTAAELARTLGHGTQQHATPLDLARHIQLGLAERDHLDYLSRRIRAAVDHVETGTSRRLVVSMPPRSGKTELVSKLTPLWLLQRNPHWRVVLASYDASMATGWAGETRRMIEDHPELGVSLTRDGGASGTWTTTAGGSLFATSVRGALTGRGANVLLVDDAVKDFVEAHSQTMRDNLWDWWLSVALTRLEPPYLVAVVGTRWHEDDFIGRLLHPEYEGDPAAWEDISLPAIAEAGDILGRDPGEPLHSPLIEETRGEALQRWADTKISVGSYAWSALFQARPAPASGAVFDMGWWRYWTTDPSKATDDGRVVCLDPAEYSGAEWVDSWDCAFGEPTGGKHTTGSFVVGQRWMRWGPDRFLIAQQRDRWSFTQTLDAMKRWADSSSPYGHLVHQRLVEAKANGVAIIDQMRNELAGIKPVKPTESKESRARAVTPEIESGNVYIPLPSEAGWVQDFLGELRAFPEAQNDDQVDCLSQALQHLRLSGSAAVRVPQGRVPRDVASAARTGFRRDMR